MPHARSVPLVVLLVEDEPLIRMATADVLTDEGHRVVEAGDGDEAMVLLDARPDISVVVTDVRMPGSLNGFMLARVVSKRSPHVGIVVSSGDSIPGKGDLPEGAVFLPKPYSPSALLREVEAMAARRAESFDAAIRPEDAVVTAEESGAAALVAPAPDKAARPAKPVEGD